MNMALLKKASNEQAYLKAGIFGFAGSGKTYTASMLAIAIAKQLKDGKPCAFFDTETGSDFLIPRFETEGIELMRVKSLALKDLLLVVKEAEQSCSCLIVDSATHIWRDLVESYMRRKNLKFMRMQDWNEPKAEWGRWMASFLNSQLHIIVCGRAGYEWDYQEVDGKTELLKTGTKMKAEGEFGYEPSLVIEMERVPRGPDIGSGWLHRAHVLKDRTDSINGRSFDFTKLQDQYKPGDFIHVYKAFEPAIKALNLGGHQLGLDTSRNNESAFQGPDGEGEYTLRKKRVAVALEEIQASLTMLWPGQDVASKKAKIGALEALFQVRAWTAVESLPLDKLEQGVRVLRKFEELTSSAVPETVEDALKLLRHQVEQGYTN